MKAYRIDYRGQSHLIVLKDDTDLQVIKKALKGTDATVKHEEVPDNLFNTIGPQNLDAGLPSLVKMAVADKHEDDYQDDNRLDSTHQERTGKGRKRRVT